MSQDKRWFNRVLPAGISRYLHLIAVGASIILGLIFITSGMGKVFDPNDFLAQLLKTSLLPYDLAVFLSVVLPWAEILLGISLVMGIAVRFMACGSFLLTIAFIFQNAWLIRHGYPADDCGCFGGLVELVQAEQQIFLSTRTALYIDIGMLVLALLIFFCYSGKLFSVVPWHLKRQLK